MITWNKEHRNIELRVLYPHKLVQSIRTTEQRMCMCKSWGFMDAVVVLSVEDGS